MTLRHPQVADSFPAVHRYRTSQALETRKYTRFEAADRSTGRASERHGQWGGKGAESTCGRADELKARRGISGCSHLFFFLLTIASGLHYWVGYG